MISIATFMTVLDTSIVNVALNHIAGGLAVSFDEATWVSPPSWSRPPIVIPISGWLADVIGRKRYYMISVAVFTVSSLACGVAPNLPLLIVARIIQGAAGGGLAAAEQSMLADTFPPKQRGLAFAAYGLVVILGPVVGPVVGGFITDNSSWRWCFLINVPIGLLSLFLVNMLVDEPQALIDERKALLAKGLRVDIIGFILVALFFGCLEVTLDRGQTDDWFASPLITTTPSSPPFRSSFHPLGADARRPHRAHRHVRAAQLRHRQPVPPAHRRDRLRQHPVHSAAPAAGDGLHGHGRRDWR